MATYALRGIEPRLWSNFRDRAEREGWPLRALFLLLIEDYADGRLVLPKGPIAAAVPMPADRTDS